MNVGGFLGLVATLVWSIFTIGWWGPIPIVLLYLASNFVPSVAAEAVTNPNVRVIAAMHQATDELSDVPPGPDKLKRVQERTQEILGNRDEGDGEKLVETSIEFTQEESVAVERYLAEVLTNTSATPGRVLIQDKAYAAMQAQGLNEYANDLLLQLNYEDRLRPESIAIARKVQQAKLKAFALHNLPIFIFQIAGSYLLTGDHKHAKSFFQRFLKSQNGFIPDKVDQVFLAQMDINVAESTKEAEEYIRQL